MTTDHEFPLTVLSCGVLKAEIEVLRQHHWPGLDIRFLSSMLHMRPEALGRALDGLIKKGPSHNTLLIYGDCCPHIEDLTQRSGIIRVRGNNCCDLLLGRAAYRTLSHQGAFFLFPEWARRWRHIFSVELGLNAENAAALMGDMHKKLVYLDTGILPVPTDDLKECAAYCQLPWEVLVVSLAPLHQAIHTALDRMNNPEAHP